MDIFKFIDNAALMLILSLLSINIQLGWLKQERVQKILLGILYGSFAVIAMEIPMVLQPGVIFDSRSVILSLAGLYAGDLTTAIAGGIAIIARILIGGSGTFTGIGSVVISCVAGLFFRKIAKEKNLSLNLNQLFIFGFVLHLILVVWFFTIPIEISLLVIRDVAIPYLVVFPTTTMLIGGFMTSWQQRLTAEKNLAKSEQRLRDLIHTLNEGVWEADAEMVTTFVNPKMAGMLGYQPAEMIGRSVYDFIDQADRPAMEKFHENRKRGISEQYEFQILRKDGKKVSVQLGVTPLRGEKGEFLGSLAGVQDISVLKNTQSRLTEQSRHLEELVEERTHDLKNAQEQLINVEKLAALGQIAGSVGHELRNPLAVISNSIYLLKMACPDANDIVREYLGMIEKETQDASRIINDLLDYSRIQPTVKEMVGLADLISGSMEKISVPLSVKIIDQIPDDLPAVKVNPRQVEQILNNLLTNAIEAMPDGGEIHLTGSMKRNVISISIADSGVGIPAKDIKRIFEPLFTTKPRGIGLGLAITSKLAELNSIAIHVKSKVGVGTTFTLDFTRPL